MICGGEYRTDVRVDIDWFAAEVENHLETINRADAHVAKQMALGAGFGKRAADEDRMIFAEADEASVEVEH